MAALPVSYAPDRPFRPARWAAGPHAQTLLAWALRPRRFAHVRRERWTTPDGDFLDLDLLEAPPGRPWVLVLHGLEGSSEAGYVRAVLRGAHQRGWGAAAMNFRSCSGELNVRLKSYSSGETEDPLWVLSELRRRGIDGPLGAVGFSLGGNVLLKLLADLGERAPLRAAVAISAPFDLAASAEAIDGAGRWMRFYRTVFLSALKRKTLRKLALARGALEPSRVRAARKLSAFDDLVTAPLYGFASAGAYYAGCSSGPRLGEIRVPTLLVNAEDDPLVPRATLPVGRPSPWVTLLRASRGGHVGFLEEGGPFPRFWAEEQAVRFLAQQLDQPPVSG